MSSAQMNSRIFAALKTLSRWLETEKIPHTIIGGIAVSLLTEPRATQDIDLTIWPEDISIENLLSTAETFGLITRIDHAIEFATQARILLLNHRESGELLSFYPAVDFKRIRELVGEFQRLLDRPEYFQKLEELLQRHSRR